MSNILRTDSYNSSDFAQLPPELQKQSSYSECRNNDFANAVYIGPQIYYKKRLCKPITLKEVEKADRRFKLMGNLDWPKRDFKKLVNNYGGYLQIEIKSVDEGMVIPQGNVLSQIQNTIDGFMPYVPNWIEAAHLRATWYPTAVATICRNLKITISQYMEISCDNLDNLDWMIHNFGSRACTSSESASISGTGFSAIFKGTDTMECLDDIEDYYHEKSAGSSVNAMKHATIGAWGHHREKGAYENFIDKFLKPGKTIAIPTDTYNHWNAIENIIGGSLKEKIVKSGGTLVVRIDSGDAISSVIKTIKILMDKFGFRTNHRGFKVLPDCIRILKSDVRSFQHIFDTFNVMHNDKFSIDNLACFGIGGEIVQKVSRDILGFVQKNSAVSVINEDIFPNDPTWYDVYKDPIDAPFKKSKLGIQALIKQEGEYKTIPEKSRHKDEENYLTTVFNCGELMKDFYFSDVRFNCAI